jgi:hypothetical protein
MQSRRDTPKSSKQSSTRAARGLQSTQLALRQGTAVSTCCTRNHTRPRESGRVWCWSGAGKCPGIAGNCHDSSRIKPGPSRSLALSSQRAAFYPAPARLSQPRLALLCFALLCTQPHRFQIALATLCRRIAWPPEHPPAFTASCSGNGHSQRNSLARSHSLGLSTTRTCSPGRHAVLPSPPLLHEPLIQTLGRTPPPSPLGLDTCQRYCTPL